MKKQGIVIEYDGFVGKIIGEDKAQYIFLKKDTLDVIKKDYIVQFEKEEVKTSKEDKPIARFVKKLY